MVKASKGGRRRTRSVLRRRARERGLSPITHLFQKFDVGENVNVKIDPSMHKGQPHVRFHGKTGTVLCSRGSAYLLSIRMGDKVKQIIVRPEHLRKAK